jgi:hypothetical protein
MTGRPDYLPDSTGSVFLAFDSLNSANSRPRPTLECVRALPIGATKDAVHAGEWPFYTLGFHLVPTRPIAKARPT